MRARKVAEIQSSAEKAVVVRTSVPGWLRRVAEFYRERASFTLLDDAEIGVDPREDTILAMGSKASLSRREWAAVLISLGIAGVGVWLIVMAVLDPEPYTKVVAIIATGAVLLGTGGLVAIRILTHVKPPDISINPKGGFEIKWH